MRTGPSLLRLSVTLLLAGLLGCAGGNARPVDSGPREPVDAGSASEDASSSSDAGPPGDDGQVADGGAPAPVSIFQIQDPERADHVAVGQAVRVEGALLSAVDTFEEEGAGLGQITDVWIAEPSGGAFSGVHVFMPRHAPCAGRTMLGVGDTVTVEATVAEFAVPSDASGRTVTQLVGGTVTCTSAGAGGAPSASSIADPAMLLDDAQAERFEGVVVELRDVEASTLADRFGTFALRGAPPVDDDLYRHAVTSRDRFTSLRGVLHYMFGRWALYPRAASDLVLGAPRTLEDGSGAWGCADGADSDGDLAIDCDDADCSSSLFCRGTSVTVQDVQDVARPMHPAAMTSVALRGALVVTAVDTFGEMSGPGYVGSVVVQDATAADPRHSGIHVFLPRVEACAGDTLSVGDRVFVAGRYEEYAAAGDTGGTLTEITSGIVSCQMPGAPAGATAIATASDLTSSARAEPWEGVLVALTDAVVTAPAGTFGRFEVSGGVPVDDDFYRASVVLGDRLSRLVGVVTYQFEYQLEPRSAADVVVAPVERDDIACGNGVDDDGDGASECSDLDCCATAPCEGAVAGRGLFLSEVLYNPAGPAADSGREWVELRNAGAGAVPLACYALGNGSTGYRYSLAQLPAITVPAGGCVVIGGPDCGSGGCTSPLDFDPDLLNAPSGTATAAGVALLYGRTASLTDASVPVDAVLYGTTNTGMLLGRGGSVPASADVPNVAAGHSIARGADARWVDTTIPTPGACAVFTP